MPTRPNSPTRQVEHLSRWSTLLITATSIGLVLLAWQVATYRVDQLPSLLDVGARVIELFSNPSEVLSLVVASVRRLIIAIAVAYSSAIVVAVLMRRSAWAAGILAPYVLAATAIPSLVAALLSVMIFGFSELGVSVATAVFLFPYVLLSLSEGFGSLDGSLSEMARAYGFRPRQYYRHVALPELGPHLFGALRSAHALGWKIVILTEVFGSGTGIGYQYKRAYDLFDLPLLISWIACFLFIVWLVEYAILRPVSIRLFRWRR